MSVNDSVHFFITPLSELKENNPDLFSFTRRAFYELLFVTSSHLTKECNFNLIRINQNDIHLSLIGQKTRICELTGDVQGFYCSFTGELFNQLYLKESITKELEFINSFLFQYPLRLNEKVAQRLNTNFEMIHRLYEEAAENSILIQAYLAICIFEIKKILNESYLDHYPQKAFLITRQYYDLLNMEESYNSLDYYADKLKISPNHLNKSIKTVCGKTAIQLLNETRLEDAKNRLRNPDISIGEIATQLGFADIAYFSRFFKKAIGLTPRSYRKNNLI